MKKENKVPTRCPICGGAADIVLGQPDFTTVELNPAAQNTLRKPIGVGYNGHFLAAADSDNNRVMVWKGLPASNQQPADFVVGQKDFAGYQPGRSATARSFAIKFEGNAPRSIEAGGRLAQLDHARAQLVRVDRDGKSEIAGQIAANLIPRTASVIAAHYVPVFLHEQSIGARRMTGDAVHAVAHVRIRIGNVLRVQPAIDRFPGFSSVVGPKRAGR